MKRTLFRCRGGEVVLPDSRLVLVDRADGGNLVVLPAREVWDRGELTLAELTGWSCLAAATGSAMLDILPQLAGGCINYWDAGNWALNDDADPIGVKKNGRSHRKVHLHLLGRSPSAPSPSYAWGEAPKFPAFRDRHAWAKDNERLTPEECRGVLAWVTTLLEQRYEIPADDLAPWMSCQGCGYPMPTQDGGPQSMCSECLSQK